MSTEQSQTPLDEVDWEGVYREYKAGQLSIRAIAAAYGTKESTIRARKKREEWGERDLSNQVRHEVKAKLAEGDAAQADDPGRTAHARDDDPERDIRAEREGIEVAATRGVEVVRSHRADIHRARTLGSDLYEELREATREREEIEEAIDEAAPNQQARNKMRSAVSLPSRAGAFRSLVQGMKELVTLERQAFNLDENPEGESYEERLRRLAEQGPEQPIPEDPTSDDR